MKRSYVTRELANAFPPWSRVRREEQEVGQQLLNGIAISMEKMEKGLMRARDNQYITTANLDEIDQIYRIQLGTSFTFDTDTTDPTSPMPIAPTVSGLDGSAWRDVSITDDNTIESFWYESVPNRLSLDSTVSGEDHELFDVDSSELPQSGLFLHHLRGGTMWLETTSGVQYIDFEGAELLRAQITLTGKTRKGTLESEALIYPWDMKQPSLKDWKEITEVSAANLPSGIRVQMRSADFDAPDYLSVWNLRYSENRNKIDEFWALGTVSGYSTLDLVEFVSDEWEQLIIGMTQKQTREQWELLTASDTNITAVDMALQPYKDRVWVTTVDTLLCYELEETYPSGMDLVKDRTQGAEIAIEMDFKHVVRSELIEFIPWHARPLKEIRKYRIWYQTPSGTKYGLLSGVQVAFTSDFWITGIDTITRTIENLVRIPADERGEYLVVLEAEFEDDTTQTEKVIASVNFKRPLVEFDLSELFDEDVLGIEFDSDQKMWLYTTSGYREIGLHADVMLIDYDNKVIYCKEDYDSVEVFTDD